ncbi:unnamed protein product [Phytomonas sp. Hart1]|nr:unnamed protein product [Phytomonas sp. Hart1]|eukprot:CCW68581.1 unnamed protein product [Phytomonas sp. isolate Hart1]
MSNLTEDDVLGYLSHSRAFPYLPFAKHVPKAGCSTAHTQYFANNNSPLSTLLTSSSVKILALLCSTTKQPAHQPSTSTVSLVRGSLDTTKEPSVGIDKAENNEDDPPHKRRRLSNDAKNGGNSVKNMSSTSMEGEKVPLKRSDSPTGSGNTQEVKSGHEGGPDSAMRRIYVRVQYDKALIETLPLEIMRERHPQILIDYLLSCSVWS